MAAIHPPSEQDDCLGNTSGNYKESTLLYAYCLKSTTKYQDQSILDSFKHEYFHVVIIKILASLVPAPPLLDTFSPLRILR